MNTLRLLTVLCAALAFNIHSSAQTVIAYNGESAYLTNKPANTKAQDDSAAFRFHKKLPSLYQGYAIEVAASNYPLDRTEGVFRKFGGIHYDKLQGGGYSYLILGRFSSEESALHFLETIIQPREQSARLIQYKEGKRSVIRDDS